MILMDPQPKFQGHRDALDVLFAQLTSDLFAIANFLVIVLSRLDRGIQSATEMLPLKRRRVLPIVLTASPAFVGYASC